ncbi:ROK family protein [uncultured Duncaniella sp.]|uniref:ROK family protein n=1 Tax=uncultured Duncaniella sp. TaxID=2768039 RepID=UPI0025AA069F|nr:ROK family protein [uncultured Duncaniella sp.]
MYRSDNRIVATLDAGGTNLVFGAMRGCEYITEPLTLPSRADDLELCLQTIVDGFTEIFSRLGDKPVAISFAFPGPADYPSGIIGGYLLNFPSFRDGVALGPFLEEKFGLPVFINNDGDLYAFGEATGGILPEINKRVADLGGHKVYRNLIGFTFGTGLGIGQVINGQLNLGNNSCVEACFLRNKSNPRIIAEDGVSIRAVIREYRKLSGNHEEDLTPYDIFKIAEGTKEGDQEAAKESFARFGEIAGDVFATAVLLSDAIVVVGGGVTGAMKYIKPALLKEMRSTIDTVCGDSVNRLPMQVLDLDDDNDVAVFAVGDSRELRIPGSDRTVIYDPMKRTGVAVSRIGASKAISIGAYNYALSQIDNVK